MTKLIITSDKLIVSIEPIETYIYALVIKPQGDHGINHVLYFCFNLEKRSRNTVA